MPRQHNPYNMTDKMFLFCQHYLSEFPRNLTHAYKAAYGVKNDKTANNAACRLMQNPKVSAYIGDEERKIQEHLSEKYIASTESVLKEEGFLAHSSIKDLFNPDGTTINPTDLPDEVAKMVKKAKPVGVKIGEDEKGNAEFQTLWEYEFWDKGQALNRLEKCFGMHIERHQHGVDEDLKSLFEMVDGKHRGKLPRDIEEDDDE